MSGSRRIIQWFGKLLFGSSSYEDPPPEVSALVREIQKHGLHPRDVFSKGGLVATPRTIQSDLDTLIRLLETRNLRNDDTPRFRTVMVADFSNRLSVITEGNAHESDSLPDPTDYRDSDVLRSILRGEDATFGYRDARFWGELARYLLHHRRPPGPMLLEEMGKPSNRFLRDVQRLYDVTCRTMGRVVDPFSMVLVPRGDHLDPVHWRSVENFISFLKTDHPLALVVRSAVEESVLDARVDGLLPADSELNTFFRNVLVVHESVREVGGTDVPPRLVDVFQRLLTLADRDHLWQRAAETTSSAVRSPASVHLYEKVLLLEKQNALLSKLLEKER